MEVEIKLRLPARAALDALRDSLVQAGHTLHAPRQQTNRFFDTVDRDLERQRIVVRLRSATTNDSDAPTWILCVKGNAVLRDGVSRVEENEVALDAALAESLAADPTLFLSLAGRVTDTTAAALIRRVVSMVPTGSKWMLAGTFTTTRTPASWIEGLTLELDECSFPGRANALYEVECETADPDRIKPLLEAWLADRGISFAESTENKYVVMRKAQRAASL
ncbi:hypothetical protein AMAG_18626 [Allomyces macrogynus ATCC 38327]|uniref:CYTH domain-containing protein n=1 Tax=Allomyces macrogynus (strain ATCC 38327) TaxID=578462 RepID=A0A0L0SG62_ALLM3|nr:hypothetical protein AMAG_18626 [Allomyces macrogynus ATCC 38327]|eukprot:KNE61434.1 hypothetical protein AMAG_18626 [Allomyces macrogynus ATCC 38327]